MARRAPPMSARRAASEPPLASTSGSPIRSPFGSSRIVTLMRTSAASAIPGMIDQLFWIWPRSASISLCESVLPLVVFLPPRAASSVERLAPPPEDSCLLSSAAISSALKSLSFWEDAFFCSFLTSSFLRSGVLAVCAGFSTLGFTCGVGTLSGRASASGFSAGCSSAGAGSGFVSGFTSCLGSGSAATSVAGSAAGLVSSTFSISSFTGSGVGGAFSVFCGAAADSFSTA